MRRFSTVLVAWIALAQFAAAEWRVVSSDAERGASAGIEHRHIELADGSASATLNLALFSAKSARLRIFDNPDGSARLAEAMSRENCAAGVNGGYFDTSFKPLGLRASDGKVTSALVRARLLTGVLCASRRGIEIERLAEFSRARRCDAAVQSGPFLVDAGAGVRTLEARRSARRTFVAVARAGNAALGVSSELTLAQLAEVLANRSLTSDCAVWRALNLDGGSSTAFWFKKADGAVFSISEDKSVRDFIGVSTR